MSEERPFGTSKHAHKPAKNHPWRGNWKANRPGRVPKYKVTIAMCLQVLEAHATGKVTQAELAIIHRVSPATICRIIKQRNWYGHSGAPAPLPMHTSTEVPLRDVRQDRLETIRELAKSARSSTLNEID